jgi:hypothetical protein
VKTLRRFLPKLQVSGFRIVQSVPPRVWPYHFNIQPGMPRTDNRREIGFNMDESI